MAVVFDVVVVVADDVTDGVVVFTVVVEAVVVVCVCVDVGVAGVEPTTLWSQTIRATNCATPRSLESSFTTSSKVR